MQFLKTKHLQKYKKYAPRSNINDAIWRHRIKKQQNEEKKDNADAISDITKAKLSCFYKKTHYKFR